MVAIAFALLCFQLLFANALGMSRGVTNPKLFLGKIRFKKWKYLTTRRQQGQSLTMN